MKKKYSKLLDSVIRDSLLGVAGILSCYIFVFCDFSLQRPDPVADFVLMWVRVIGLGVGFFLTYLSLESLISPSDKNTGGRK